MKQRQAYKYAQALESWFSLSKKSFLCSCKNSFPKRGLKLHSQSPAVLVFPEWLMGTTLQPPLTGGKGGLVCLPPGHGTGPVPGPRPLWLSRVEGTLLLWPDLRTCGWKCLALFNRKILSFRGSVLMPAWALTEKHNRNSFPLVSA